MKVIICLASFIAVASASHLAAPLAAVSTGASSQYRSQNSAGQYSFGYDESGATGGSFRHEKSDLPGTVQGSYGLRTADGRLRVVSYQADALGYRANIQTNEPGVEPKDPAATLINKAPVAVAAPAPVAVAAPAPVAVAAPAPLPAYAPAPVAVAAPAPVAVAAPAPFYAAPAPIAAPIPSAFSYNSVVSHLAGPVALPAYGPAPLAAPIRAY
uniref:Cuticle protein 14 isoform a n=1 Tax=Aceria tosichella TaxID=561515 RepID=A0A6G1SAP6_9ACAR